MEDKKQIIVRPVVRLKRWVNTDTFQKNKLLGAGTTISPYVDLHGTLHTGMNKEEQADLEEELMLKEGELVAKLNNPFWDSYTIKLDDEPNVFLPKIARDRLKLFILKAHKIVASSLETVTPDSEFYIEDLEEQIDKKAKLADDKEEAYRIFSNMTGADKRAVLKLYGKGGKDLTDKAVKAELMSELEDNIDSFTTNASQGKDVIKMRAFIFDLNDHGIIRKRNEYYFDGDSDLGTSAQFGDFLLSPDKQDIYENYKARLEQAEFGRD